MRMIHLSLCVSLTLFACAEGGGGASPGESEASNGEQVSDERERGAEERGGFQAAEEIGVAFSPQSVSFGAIPVGTTEERLIEVLHSGSSGVLELTNLEYVAQQGQDLSLDEVSTTRLQPGEAISLRLVYAPSDAEADRGEVRIDTNTIDASGEALTIVVPVDAPPLASEVVSDSAVLGFGGVATGTEKTRTLSLLNVGTLDASIVGLSVEGASASEFELSELSEEPLPLLAGANLPIEVTYRPQGLDTDTATLRIDALADDGPSELFVPLSGHEISAELKATPSPLDFGQRSPNEAHVERITLSSENPDVDLEITQVSVTSLGAYGETMSIADWPEEGVIITHDAPYELEVTFTPTEDMLASYTPLAELSLETNDPSEGGTQRVALYGQRLGSGLEVHPPDVVYFGYVGIGATVSREVTLYNAGNAPINVESIYTEGDFKLDDDDAWGPTSAQPAPGELMPGELKTLSLSFTTSGPPLETTWGKLVILSDDGQKPTWEVLLNVQKVEGDDCLLQFVPSGVEFGMVAPWTAHTRTMTLVNIGSGPCAYQSAVVDDCAPDQACEPTPDAEMSPTTSAHYAVSAEPEPGAVIAPGETAPIEVTFIAPAASPVITPYPGLLRARVSSVSGATGESVLTHHPSSESWLQIPNLEASVGVGIFEVNPTELDFQLVEIGCVSPPTEIVGSNVGLAHLDVTGWWLEGCTDEVSVLEAPDPEAVHRLQPGETITWTFDYAPVDESTDTCTLFIASSDAQSARAIPVSGRGDYPAQLVDLFTDSEAQKVDVLFVVDDSGSMSEEQENLSGSFEAFIQEAASWDSDYRIGVTTTTISLFELSGGALYGSPPWVTEANWEKFVNIVEVGTTGSGDEQGIWAAFIATSSPAIDPPEGTCELDTDCSLNRICHEGQCQGINYSFFRDDAALEVVFVSDEEDNSPEELDAYLNHFRAIKGYDHPELLHMHAIVGPPGGCNSSNGSALAGHRYMNMAEATGGAIYSICELDFAKGLEGIGEIAFASKMEYTLTQVPAPTTIVVTIEGLPCPQLTGGVFNWVYDADDNTVTLTEEGICMAGSGDEVLIAYDLLCYAESD